MSATTEGRVATNEKGPAGDQRAGRAAVGKREVRWSARRKEEVVLRPLRGESLDSLARESGQAAGTISGWRDEFLAAGRRPGGASDAMIEFAQSQASDDPGAAAQVGPGDSASSLMPRVGGTLDDGLHTSGYLYYGRAGCG